VLPEILHEVVLTLEALYKVPREDVSAVLIELLNFDNIFIADEYIRALFLYSNKELSFLEAVLCAYGKDRKVVSFSKRVKKCLKS
jgi:predicted nucleic-acid-binding protein